MKTTSNINNENLSKDMALIPFKSQVSCFVPMSLSLSYILRRLPRFVPLVEKKSASPSISRSVCAVKLLADAAFAHLCLGAADNALRAVRRFCAILDEFPGIMRQVPKCTVLYVYYFVFFFYFGLFCTWLSFFSRDET